MRFIIRCVDVQRPNRWSKKELRKLVRGERKNKIEFGVIRITEKR